jgi:hypothetical protein
MEPFDVLIVLFVHGDDLHRGSKGKEGRDRHVSGIG